MKKLMRKKKQSGFTLLEIMVVIAIIAILGSFVAPSLFGQADKAKVISTKTQVTSIETALELYRLDNGAYPSTSQGLDALVTQPQGSPAAPNWQSGGYMKQIPTDSWGNNFIYLSQGRLGPYEIISYGSDGVEGGSDYAKDISSAAQ